MKNVLEIDGVILEFNNKRILQNVYLKIEQGKITGLLGRNGTGKSSLMKILFGDLIPQQKSIRLNGRSILKANRAPKNMRYLPQSNFIPNTLSTKRVFSDFNLDFGTFTKHFSEFSKYYHSKIKHLSGGEKRIIEIYVLLVSDTKICMLDEPFSQVMPLHVESIKNLILQEKENKGILLTDHLYKHITDICDELYIIENGQTHLTKNKMDLERLGYAPRSKK